MELEQLEWRPGLGWRQTTGGLSRAPALVLLFAAREVLDRDREECLAPLLRRYPGVPLVGCSAAGEIRDIRVGDGGAVAVALAPRQGHIRVESREVTAANSRICGAALGQALAGPDLRLVFVLAEGVALNGTALVAGLRETLPPDCILTGGLAADGDRFQVTRVVVDHRVSSGLAAAVGFYGPSWRVGYGSVGGWDSFGPDRLITKASGNVLYELDGRPALALYRRYLGELAAGLPATGLYFPLSLRRQLGDEAGLVRTLMAINEADGSLTFAAEIPEGHYARLMKANFERLIDGAGLAAECSRQQDASASPCLALLVSCVGRKLLLEQRVEEELERVREVLGPEALLTGFYSYGEICPQTTPAGGGRCELHNQTMTITTLGED